jgi:hypothetical protein
MATHESSASFAWFPLTELTESIREALAKPATNCLFGPLASQGAHRCVTTRSALWQASRNSHEDIESG